jgi:glutamyl-tRNA reductase
MREATLAEGIVTEEVERYRRAESARGVVPTIKALRERFLEVAHAEAQRTLGRLNGASDRDRREVEMLAESIVNKLLHPPLTVLKRQAESEVLVDAVRALFELPDPATQPEGTASKSVATAAEPAPAAALGPARAAAEPAVVDPSDETPLPRAASWGGEPRG